MGEISLSSFLLYLKSVPKNWKQTIQLIFFFFLSFNLIIGLTSKFTITYYSRFETLHEQTYPADFAIFCDFCDLEAIHEIFNAEYTQNYLGYRTRQVSQNNITTNLPITSEISTWELNFSDIEFRDYIISYTPLIGGNFPENSNEVLIFSSDSYKHNLTVGDEIQANHSSVIANLTISGVIETDYDGEGRGINDNQARFELIFTTSGKTPFLESFASDNSGTDIYFYLDHEKLDILNIFQIRSRTNRYMDEMISQLISNSIIGEDFNSHNYNPMIDDIIYGEFGEFFRFYMKYMFIILLPIFIISILMLHYAMKSFSQMKSSYIKELRFFTSTRQMKKYLIGELIIFYNFVPYTISILLTFCVNFFSRFFLPYKFIFISVTSVILLFLLTQLPFFLLMRKTVLEIETELKISPIINQYVKKKKRRNINKISSIIMIVLLSILSGIVLIENNFSEAELMGTSFYFIKDLLYPISNPTYQIIAPVLFGIIGGDLVLQGMHKLIKFWNIKISPLTKEYLQQILKNLRKKEKILRAIITTIIILVSSVFSQIYRVENEIQLETTRLYNDIGGDFQVLSPIFSNNSSKSIGSSLKISYSKISLYVASLKNETDEYNGRNTVLLIQFDADHISSVLNEYASENYEKNLYSKVNQLGENEILISKSMSIKLDFSSNEKLHFRTIEDGPNILENESIELEISDYYNSLPFNIEPRFLTSELTLHLHSIEVLPIITKSTLNLSEFLVSGHHYDLYLIRQPETGIDEILSEFPSDYRIIENLYDEIQDLENNNHYSEIYQFMINVHYILIIHVIIFIGFLFFSFLHSQKRLFQSLCFHGLKKSDISRIIMRMFLFLIFTGITVGLCTIGLDSILNWLNRIHITTYTSQIYSIKYIFSWNVLITIFIFVGLSLAIFFVTQKLVKKYTQSIYPITTNKEKTNVRKTR
ncbi:MAG: hypothetical protein EU530_02570 [Promethearchaeota archaeon]|nr:MAG: hypothetical protein EU530_02570 [Candidatus Lokiarchaeota archaeon]